MGQAVVRRRLDPAKHAERRIAIERCFMTLPVEARRSLGTLVLRRPPTSPLRKGLLGWLVVRGFAAVEREDWELLRSFYAEDIEYSMTSPDGTPFIGEAEGRHGMDGLIAMFEEVLQMFDFATYRVLEVLDAGDWFVTLTEMDLRGRASGIEMAQEQGHVYNVVDGRIIRQRTYFSARTALETVGLAHIADELEA